MCRIFLFPKPKKMKVATAKAIASNVAMYAVVFTRGESPPCNEECEILAESHRTNVFPATRIGKSEVFVRYNEKNNNNKYLGGEESRHQQKNRQCSKEHPSDER